MAGWSPLRVRLGNFREESEQIRAAVSGQGSSVACVSRRPECFPTNHTTAVSASGQHCVGPRGLCSRETAVKGSNLKNLEQESSGVNVISTFSFLSVISFQAISRPLKSAVLPRRLALRSKSAADPLFRYIPPTGARSAKVIDVEYCLSARVVEIYTQVAPPPGSRWKEVESDYRAHRRSGDLPARL